MDILDRLAKQDSGADLNSEQKSLNILNIIYKNLAWHNINDFKMRFEFLIQQKLEDGFKIIK